MKKPKIYAKKEPESEIEKAYPKKEFILKLYRLIKAIEKGWGFTLQIGERRIQIPSNTKFFIEYERENGNEEVEFAIKWKERKP